MNSDIAAAQNPAEYSFNGSIFFYCCGKGYSHLSICLAEGLQALGIPFYANINYWQIDAERENYLFFYDD